MGEAQTAAWAPEATHRTLPARLFCKVGHPPSGVGVGWVGPAGSSFGFSDPYFWVPRGPPWGGTPDPGQVPPRRSELKKKPVPSRNRLPTPKFCDGLRRKQPLSISDWFHHQAPVCTRQTPTSFPATIPTDKCPPAPSSAPRTVRTRKPSILRWDIYSQSTETENPGQKDLASSENGDPLPFQPNISLP